MNAVAYTNRYEIKYRVPVRRLPEIKREIGEFLVGDENGDETGGYFNYSVYFDSPDYKFYVEKREGELTRIKPRIRLYRYAADQAPTGIFLELKARYDRIVNKRRTAISMKAAETFLSGAPMDGLEADRDAAPSVVGEFIYLRDRYALVPSVTVLYHRTAFNGAFYPGLRITFDRTIQCSMATALDNPDHAFIDMLPPNWFIIELKYNNHLPAMLLKRLHALGLEQETLSKYALGIEKSYDHLRHPFIRA